MTIRIFAFITTGCWNELRGLAVRAGRSWLSLFTVSDSIDDHTMTEDQVVRVLRQYFESLFPKVCPNCRRRFKTLREYILITERLGPARSYDADLGDWKTTQPIGSVAQANCPCGSTLALGTEKMMLPQRLALLAWLHGETHRRSVSPSDLLDYLRDKVRQQALEEPSEGNDAGRL